MFSNFPSDAKNDLNLEHNFTKTTQTLKLLFCVFSAAMELNSMLFIEKLALKIGVIFGALFGNLIMMAPLFSKPIFKMKNTSMQK